MGRQVCKFRKGRSFFLLVVYLLFLFASFCEAAEIVVIGDTRLKPVSDVVRFVEDALPHAAAVYMPKDVKGRLDAIVAGQRAKVVVALGSEALDEALSLPESVPVVYGLVVRRVIVRRQNVTGIYMATPVSDYISYVNRYFPSLRKVGVVHGPEYADAVAMSASPQLVSYRAVNSYEFIKRITALDKNVDALLLLPERDLLTSTSVEELFRCSFTAKVPVIGVSEKYVKKGALFALTFNEPAMGAQIGEMVKRVLAHGDASGIPPSSPEKFDLFLNAETSRMMKVPIPPDLIRKARRVYP